MPVLMSSARPVGRKAKKLLLPAVLVVSGASCTPPSPSQCGSERYHACWPDGGFACPPECGALKQADGGLELDAMARPQCLC